MSVKILSENLPRILPSPLKRIPRVPDFREEEEKYATNEFTRSSDYELNEPTAIVERVVVHGIYICTHVYIYIDWCPAGENREKRVELNRPGYILESVIVIIRRGPDYFWAGRPQARRR